MTKAPPVISVAVVDNTAFLKIPGRANFTSSVDFKTVVAELRGRGVDHFILDLGECVTMDSTFLGVLAGIALRHADGKEMSATSEKLRLDLLNPNAGISDLLENLRVVHLFNVFHHENPCTAIFEPIDHQEAASRLEMCKISLEAHEVLMRIKPENIPKFKDVAQFLAEDLRKLKEQNPPSSC